MAALPREHWRKLNMEATTIQKFIHSTPRKLRLVADMVRTMEPSQALETLKFTQKSAAEDIAKAIKTAMAGAKQKGFETIVFKSIEVNEGPKMRRFRAGTRGRVKPYKKRMAHIKIVLTDLNVKNQILNVKTKKAEETVKKDMKGEQTEVVVDDSAEKADETEKDTSGSVQK
jgi:large subunit ribosomal protein L22